MHQEINEKPPIFIDIDGESIKPSQDNDKNLVIELPIKHRRECCFPGDPQMHFNLSAGRFRFDVEGARIVHGEERENGFNISSNVLQITKKSPNEFSVVIHLYNLLAKVRKIEQIESQLQPTLWPSNSGDSIKPLKGCDDRQGIYDFTIKDDYEFKEIKLFSMDGILEFDRNQEKAEICFYTQCRKDESCQIIKSDFRIREQKSWGFLKRTLFRLSKFLNSGSRKKFSTYVALGFISLIGTIIIQLNGNEWLADLLFELGLDSTKSSTNSPPLSFWKVSIYCAIFIVVLYFLFGFFTKIVERILKSEVRLKAKIASWISDRYGEDLDRKCLVYKKESAQVPIRLLTWIESLNPMSKEGGESEPSSGNRGGPSAGSGSGSSRLYGTVGEELLRLIEQLLGDLQGDTPPFIQIDLAEKNGYLEAEIRGETFSKEPPTPTNVPWQSILLADIPERYKLIKFNNFGFREIDDDSMKILRQSRFLGYSNNRSSAVTLAFGTTCQFYDKSGRDRTSEVGQTNLPYIILDPIVQPVSPDIYRQVTATTNQPGQNIAGGVGNNIESTTSQAEENISVDNDIGFS